MGMEAFGSVLATIEFDALDAPFHAHYDRHGFAHPLPTLVW